MLKTIGWVTTVRQAAPRFFELVQLLKPTVHVASIKSVDEAFLATHAASAILWDVDGTLMPHHDRVVASEVKAILAAVGRRVPQAIVSNCNEERLAELGVLFAELPVFQGYHLETGDIALRRLHEGRDEWSLGEFAGRRPFPAPPAGALPIRKPNADVIERVIEAIGADRERVFMVGDQYFTDIAGANLAGIRSVKVDTLSPASFPLPVRGLQLLERTVYRVLYGGGQ
jgi:predicted HAD superfamily phosphohydrolase YqeG